MTELHDMHCHLDFMANGEDVAAEAASAGTLLFANCVTPQGWTSARERFAAFGNVRVGFGMHPWWASEQRGGTPAASAGDRAGSQRAAHRQAQRNAALAPSEDDRELQRRVLDALDRHDPGIIGEIGLDFGWRHQATRAAQTEMFACIARWAARKGGKLLSIHSVKAAAEALDILEQSGAVRSCRCVFHWFTGPSDLLKRAVADGCYFSCGTRMLATGKGREYAKAIPEGQLLLETDAPPERGMAYSYAQLRTQLEEAARGIADIKGEAALDTIAETSRLLLETGETCREGHSEHGEEPPAAPSGQSL